MQEGPSWLFQNSHLKSLEDFELHAHLEFEAIPNFYLGQMCLARRGDAAGICIRNLRTNF